MSKLYGKTWAEGHPGKMSTRAAHNEITAQVLYGSKSDSKVAAELTVKVDDNGEFTLFLNIPAYEIEDRRYYLP